MGGEFSSRCSCAMCLACVCMCLASPHIYMACIQGGGGGGMTCFVFAEVGDGSVIFVCVVCQRSYQGDGERNSDLYYCY
jgi:hypothetical protein